MIVRHWPDPDMPVLPACGDPGPDSSGTVSVVFLESDVDCPACLEALDLHVCGVDPYDNKCSGCVWLAGTDNVVALRA